MNKEIYKPIPNRPDYFASNYGNIKHKNHVLKPFIIRKPNSKRVVYKIRIGTKAFSVARLVASAFYGESDLTVNHINGNTLDNRAINLEWCSLEENIRKGYETGLYQSIMKPIKITIKETGETKCFRGLGVCERTLGIQYDYFSKRIKKGIFENEKYKWELI